MEVTISLFQDSKGFVMRHAEQLCCLIRYSLEDHVTLETGIQQTKR